MQCRHDTHLIPSSCHGMVQMLWHENKLGDMSSDKIQGCTLFLGLGCVATDPCPLTNMDEIQYASNWWMKILF